MVIGSAIGAAYLAYSGFALMRKLSRDDRLME